MKKPNAVAELLAELETEDIRSEVETTKNSKAILFIEDEDEVEDDAGIAFTADECKLLFSSVDTVNRLVEALNGEDATLILFEVTVSDRVLGELERSFKAVDEG